MFHNCSPCSRWWLFTVSQKTHAHTRDAGWRMLVSETFLYSSSHVPWGGQCSVLESFRTEAAVCHNMENMSETFLYSSSHVPWCGECSVRPVYPYGFAVPVYPYGFAVPVYPYGFAVTPTDSDLKFRSYTGWVRNYGHCPIFPFPRFKLE